MDQNIYTLLYTNECLHSIEHEFEAVSDEVARIKATAMCRGQEGLWSGIYLTDPQGEAITFDPF
ncbi:hypothetical protein P3P1_03 [Pseudomonas aeruginosa]|uniref:Uncharacterized protein n=2 Tax=Litunavirus TaxID=1920762 RepID=A0A0A7NPE0_9CAUD|nr:hypothetical protein PP759_gp03 [Pseudomonas phage vB_Pae575P-3]AIZ94935.1 hypothetical protein [Pseudomonas phage phi176]ANT44279.1 hypothetical protein vB_Pae575P-3_03 [Pseudomonas phage vB_Pae575P-3]ANT44371.1 hypothetical protein vB_Pae1369P-5_03 [Pseudomonas phage vB_Pae1396P-5]SBT96749.2 hypothetical protein P3P1_03 [Pseudomonas aeruginosa]